MDYSLIEPAFIDIEIRFTVATYLIVINYLVSRYLVLGEIIVLPWLKVLVRQQDSHKIKAEHINNALLDVIKDYHY